MVRARRRISDSVANTTNIMPGSGVSIRFHAFRETLATSRRVNNALFIYISKSTNYLNNPIILHVLTSIIIAPSSGEP